MTRFLLGVDPGASGAGCGLFADDALVSCAFVRNAVRSGPRSRRGAEMARAVVSWFYDEVFRLTSLIARAVPPPAVALEWPRVYQRGGGRTKGDPNDLLILAGVDTALAALLPESEIREVEPSEWKGQVPKLDKAGENVVERRVRARLSEVESLALASGESGVAPSLVHNVYDGVAIGLWGLGRFERKVGVVR